MRALLRHERVIDHHVRFVLVEIKHPTDALELPVPEAGRTREGPVERLVVAALRHVGHDSVWVTAWRPVVWTQPTTITRRFSNPGSVRATR